MPVWLYPLLALAAVFVLLLLTVVIRALAFHPKKKTKINITPITVNEKQATDELAAMIRCRTVSDTDSAREDAAEFEKFEKLLPTLYPNVFATCERIDVKERAILLRWRGKSENEPTVLMSHYDVVSVEESGWTHAPFDGVVENGILYGRGTLDTKVTLAAALHAAETLLKKGFVPTRDVYFAFSGNEEISGNGAPAIVRYFEEHGIVLGAVFDEGGAVVENVFPGVKLPSAMVGIAEKGMMNLEFSVNASGGHASAPPPITPIGRLSRACCRVESSPFPMQLSKPAALMFDTLPRHSTLLYRVIFANLWLFSPVLNALCKKSGGEMNALVRTTVAYTQMQGSKGMNVLPAKASMLANLRLAPGDTEQTVLKRMKRTIKDDAVTLRVVGGHEPSRVSRTDVEPWSRLCAAIEQTWEDTIVCPYLMVACSDSRHYGRISDRVYRFSAMALSQKERASIHGNDEGIPVQTITKAVEFYTRLLLNS